LGKPNEAVGWEAAYRKRPSGELVSHEDTDSLNQLFQTHQVRRILDLGCGDGRHLVYFARQGYEMFGLDSAPTALRLAKEWLTNEGLSAQLFCADMSTILLPQKFFDAVICVQTINHQRIEGIRLTIKEIYRVLRPEGWLFLTVSTTRPTGLFRNGIKVEANTYVLLSGHEKGVPHHFFNMEELHKEFSQFEIVNLHEDSRNYTCMLALKP